MTESRKDTVLSRVIKYLEIGWPAKVNDAALSPFYRRQSDLSLEAGCVLWGSRVLIPTTLQPAMMKELHSSHAGAARMKKLARSYLWWPGMDEALERLSASCQKCLENRPMPPKAELHPWEWPKSPWHRLHIDHAGPLNGNQFLIIVDAHTKWVEIIKVSGTTSRETISCLQHLFAQFGLPISICSDNASCFTSDEFQCFMKNCGVKHITTAVGKPSTNGLAERMVQTFKKMLLKSTDPLQLAIDKFLFNYRSTPHSTTGQSPAQLMFGRKLRTRLDLLWPSDIIKDKVSSQQMRMQRNHCRKPRRTNLNVGSPVMSRNFARGSKWLPGRVEQRTGPVSFKVRLEDGNLIRRHQDQLHSSSVPGDALADDPIQPSPTQTPTHAQPLPLRRSTRERKPVDRLDL